MTKREKVLDLYGSSIASAKEIAARIGVTSGSVSVFLSVARRNSDRRVAAGDRARAGIEPRRETFWTAERDADLKRLAGERRSAAEIGAALGCTRNAVIGRCGRTGVALNPGTRRSFWTDKKITQLRDLWPDLRLTTASIGQAIGTTQGAVEGMAKRLDLPKRTRPKVEKAKTTDQHGGHRNVASIAAAAEAKRTYVEPEQRANAFRDRPASIAHADLRSTHCQWPLGEKPYRFCGCPQALGRPYCTEHEVMSRGRGTPGERRADDERDADRRAA